MLCGAAAAAVVAAGAVAAVAVQVSTMNNIDSKIFPGIKFSLIL